MDVKTNEIDNAKTKLHMLIGSQTEIHKTAESVVPEIPEIKDIYDSIYGNVQSKLQFYENKRSNSVSVSSTPPRSISLDLSDAIENNQKKELNDNNTPSGSPPPPIFKDSGDEDSTSSKGQYEQSLEPPMPPPRKISDTTTNPDLLNDCSHQCPNCEKTDYINDRSDALIEINANLKIEVDCIKQDLKHEIEKNNALNFEIANIENALETYYKEAKYHKSALSIIYSSLKSYSGKSEEGYTYKRIKAISDHMETLKVKLQHQDRIIRENFVENPYTTDMMMKYDAILQQLDKLSKENQELKNQLKKKAEEEIEIIKELNRQKFKIEEKCREVEIYYKKELTTKDNFIDDIQETHKKELNEFQILLEQKVEEVTKLRKIYEAKITNSQDELTILYRKLKNAAVDRKLDISTK